MSLLIFKETSKYLSIYKRLQGNICFSSLLKINLVSLPEKRKEYPWQVPQILVNKVESKVRVFNYFHDEWKADCRRDDENMKIIMNEKDNDLIQIDLFKEPTKNQVNKWNSCY